MTDAQWQWGDRLSDLPNGDQAISKEERLIEEIAERLFRWKGGGFNTNERMSEARSEAVKLISDVRRMT